MTRVIAIEAELRRQFRSAAGIDADPEGAAADGH